MTRLTDAERSAQITALHALAVQRRQTARLWSTTAGYQHWCELAVGVRPPEPAASTLASAGVDAELAGAAACEQTIRRLRAMPSDAAHRATASNNPLDLDAARRSTRPTKEKHR